MHTRPMHTRPFLVTLLAVTALSACTWVEPTEEGYAVNLADPAAVSNCQSIGVASAEVPDSIVFIPRSEEKVEKELLTLGKNQAAKMGGDTVTEEGPAFQGEQRFRVYRCNN